MSEELRPCPFCGSKNTTLDYFEISCSQELGTLVFCGDCGSYSTSIDRWNTRPIEDKLRAQLAERDALIERLVEAGETIYCGRWTCRLGSEEPLKKWNMCVAEWQAMKGGKEGYWYARGNLLDYIASLEAQLAERGALHPALEAFVKNVQDLICQIITACTYQDEPTAAAGKYSLPIDCFRSMEALSLASHNISDGACVLATENRTTKESVE